MVEPEDTDPYLAYADHCEQMACANETDKGTIAENGSGLALTTSRTTREWREGIE